jgi:hypothetical protein
MKFDEAKPRSYKKWALKRIKKFDSGDVYERIATKFTDASNICYGYLAPSPPEDLLSISDTEWYAWANSLFLNNNLQMLINGLSHNHTSHIKDQFPFKSDWFKTISMLYGSKTARREILPKLAEEQREEATQVLRALITVVNRHHLSQHYNNFRQAYSGGGIRFRKGDGSNNRRATDALFNVLFTPTHDKIANQMMQSPRTDIRQLAQNSKQLTSLLGSLPVSMMAVGAE